MAYESVQIDPAVLEQLVALMQQQAPEYSDGAAAPNPLWTNIPQFSAPNGLARVINQDVPGSGEVGTYNPQESLLMALQQEKISPEDAALYLTTPVKGETDWDAAGALAQQLAPQDFSKVAGKAGLEEAEIERQLSGDLQRWGVNSLDEIAAQTTAQGDTLYYNTRTGKPLPENFGSDMTGEDGRYFRLVRNPDGSVGVSAQQRTSSDWDSARGVATVAGVLGGGAALDLALNGAIGAGMSGASGGAAASGGTGLSTLPQAGTWSHVGAPAATQGAWTSPAALSGVQGVTQAGGLTLADTLANTYARDPLLSGIPAGEGVTVQGGGPGFPGGANIIPTESPSLLDGLFDLNKVGDVGLGPNAAQLLSGLMTPPAQGAPAGRRPFSFEYASATPQGAHLRTLGSILGR